MPDGKQRDLGALAQMRNHINKNKQDGNKPEDGIAFDLHGTEELAARMPLFVLPSTFRLSKLGEQIQKKHHFKNEIK